MSGSTGRSTIAETAPQEWLISLCFIDFVAEREAEVVPKLSEGHKNLESNGVCCWGR